MTNKYSVMGNYDKLPQELKAQLQTLSQQDIQILKLFLNETRLNVDNILIGLFIEYNLKPQLKDVQNSLKKLLKLNELKQEKGVYFLPKLDIKK